MISTGTRIPPLTPLAAALAAAGILAACAPCAAGGPLAALAPPDSTVIATVGRATVTAGDLRLAYTSGEGVDLTLPAAALKRDLLEKLINRKLAVLEAEDRRLHRTASLTRFMRRLERSLAAEELRKRIYAGKVEVTEDELRELYERYAFSFRVRHLSVDNRELAQELHARLEAGEDFGALAGRYSEDRKTAAEGGDMGTITAGILVIEFEDAIFRLQPGQITPVIKGKGEHYKIFKLESMARDREPPASFADLRAALEQRVQVREGGAAHYAWQLRTLEDYDFQLDEQAYTTFADALRDKIAAWEAIVAVDADSLSEGWIFESWPPELQNLVVGRFQGGRLTVAEFLKSARDMQACPTCLWRDSDVQLRQQLRGLAFDKMYELELRKIRSADLPWIEREMARRRADHLVDMLGAVLAVKPEEVPEEDVRAYYDARAPEFRVPRQARVRRLVVAAEDQARDLWERLQGGADFGTLAERFSIDERTNYKGGETEFFGPGTLEGMAEVALAHEAGDLVAPFQTKLGWEIIEVLEIKPERQATYQESQPAIRRYLAREQSRQAVLDRIAARRTTTSISVRDTVLATISLTAS